LRNHARDRAGSREGVDPLGRPEPGRAAGRTEGSGQPSIGIPLMTDRPEKDDHLPRYGMNRTYFEAVRRAGGIPVPIAPGRVDEIERYIAPLAARSSSRWGLDGLCLTGGGDLDPRFFGQERRPGCNDPDIERDEMEYALLAAALPLEMPLLAVCRGIQVLNAFLGGTLLQDIAREKPEALDHAHHPGRPRGALVHEIHFSPGSRAAELLGPSCWVNSLHHQAADRVAEGLVVTGLAPDGVIEALERPRTGESLAEEIERGRFLLAVQFHPEDLPEEPRMQGLFTALARAAAAYRARNRP